MKFLVLNAAVGVVLCYTIVLRSFTFSDPVLDFQHCLYRCKDWWCI